jgi:hypothetical protein
MLVKVEVYNDGAAWCARGIGQDIFTQGQTVDKLYENIREAIALHFDGEVPPSEIDILVVSEPNPAGAPPATS